MGEFGEGSDCFEGISRNGGVILEHEMSYGVRKHMHIYDMSWPMHNEVREVRRQNDRMVDVQLQTPTSAGWFSEKDGRYGE